MITEIEEEKKLVPATEKLIKIKKEKNQQKIDKVRKEK